MGVPVNYDVELINDAIKYLTEGHSDMTFLAWSRNISKEIKVYSESLKQGRRGRRATSSHNIKIKKQKYRHYMTEDNKEKLPPTAKRMKSDQLR